MDAALSEHFALPVQNADVHRQCSTARQSVRIAVSQPLRDAGRQAAKVH
jgi:hypothetical protein